MRLVNEIGRDNPVRFTYKLGHFQEREIVTLGLCHVPFRLPI
jgi:hypothetical protein